METAYTKNIFLDSSINTEGNDGRLARWICPAEGFSVNTQQFIKMTLNSFSMRRNWYNINTNNCIFYSLNGLTYTEYVIQQGNYTTFTSLATAIQNAIQVVHPLATVLWDPTSRKFQFDMTLALTFNAIEFFVGFICKTGTPPGGVSDLGFFNDSFEILGGRPTRDVNIIQNLMAQVGTAVPAVGNIIHESYYVGALNTIAELVIRTSLQGGNYQSFGYERNLPSASGLTNTDIIARIPIDEATWTPQKEFIHFEDFDDNFSVIIPEKQLSQMVFSVGDHKGRLIPEVNFAQAQDGALSFRLSLKMSVMNDISSREHITLPSDIRQKTFNY
jgi:hypothetical protein